MSLTTSAGARHPGEHVQGLGLGDEPVVPQRDRGPGQGQQAQVDPDVAAPPLRMAEGRPPEARQVPGDEVGQLRAGDRRQEAGQRPAMQDQAEAMQLAPGHRRDPPDQQLLERPRQVRARRILQFLRREGNCSAAPTRGERRGPGSRASRPAAAPPRPCTVGPGRRSGRGRCGPAGSHPRPATRAPTPRPAARRAGCPGRSGPGADRCPRLPRTQYGPIRAEPAAYAPGYPGVSGARGAGGAAARASPKIAGTPP